MLTKTRNRQRNRKRQTLATPTHIGLSCLDRGEEHGSLLEGTETKSETEKSRNRTNKRSKTKPRQNQNKKGDLNNAQLCVLFSCHARTVGGNTGPCWECRGDSRGQWRDPSRRKLLSVASRCWRAQAVTLTP